MKNTVKGTVSLEQIPLRLKNNIDMDRLFSIHNFAVAVNYYVLRSKEKSNC